MAKKRILFVCVHNSARSQMAEALLNSLAGDRFEAESAGIEPGKLNPVVVEAMRQISIDISSNATKSVAAVIDRARPFDYIITVCDETSAERCPVFPGPAKRLHWSFPDPSAFTGSFEERLTETSLVRDQIRQRVTEWVGDIGKDVSCGALTDVVM
jgi:arsenate reductase